MRVIDNGLDCGFIPPPPLLAVSFFSLSLLFLFLPFFVWLSFVCFRGIFDKMRVCVCVVVVLPLCAACYMGHALCDMRLGFVTAFKLRVSWVNIPANSFIYGSNFILFSQQ